MKGNPPPVKNHVDLSTILKPTITPVFGIPVEEFHDRVEYFLDACFDLLREDVDSEGLFRIPGTMSLVNRLKQSFDEGVPFGSEIDELGNASVHDVASLLKLFYRDLPASPFPTELIQILLQASFTITKEPEKRSAIISHALHQLPWRNYFVVKQLLEFLKYVTEFQASNKMDSRNLAIVFAPNFFKGMRGIDVMAFMLDNYDTLFPIPEIEEQKELLSENRLRTSTICRSKHFRTMMEERYDILELVKPITKLKRSYDAEKKRAEAEALAKEQGNSNGDLDASTNGEGQENNGENVPLGTRGSFDFKGSFDFPNRMIKKASSVLTRENSHEGTDNHVPEAISEKVEDEKEEGKEEEKEEKYGTVKIKEAPKNKGTGIMDEFLSNGRVVECEEHSPKDNSIAEELNLNAEEQTFVMDFSDRINLTSPMTSARQPRRTQSATQHELKGMLESVFQDDHNSNDNNSNYTHANSQGSGNGHSASRRSPLSEMKLSSSTSCLEAKAKVQEKKRRDCIAGNSILASASPTPGSLLGGVEPSLKEDPRYSSMSVHSTNSTSSVVVQFGSPCISPTLSRQTTLTSSSSTSGGEEDTTASEKSTTKITTITSETLNSSSTSIHTTTTTTSITSTSTLSTSTTSVISTAPTTTTTLSNSSTANSSLLHTASSDSITIQLETDHDHANGNEDNNGLSHSHTLPAIDENKLRVAFEGEENDYDETNSCTDGERDEEQKVDDDNDLDDIYDEFYTTLNEQEVNDIVTKAERYSVDIDYNKVDALTKQRLLELKGHGTTSINATTNTTTTASTTTTTSSTDSSVPDDFTTTANINSTNDDTDKGKDIDVNDDGNDDQNGAKALSLQRSVTVIKRHDSITYHDSSGDEDSPASSPAQPSTVTVKRSLTLAERLAKAREEDEDFVVRKSSEDDSAASMKPLYRSHSHTTVYQLVSGQEDINEQDPSLKLRHSVSQGFIQLNNLRDRMTHGKTLSHESGLFVCTSEQYKNFMETVYGPEITLSEDTVRRFASDQNLNRNDDERRPSRAKRAFENLSHRHHHNHHRNSPES